MRTRGAKEDQSERTRIFRARTAKRRNRRMSAARMPTSLPEVRVGQMLLLEHNKFLRTSALICDAERFQELVAGGCDAHSRLDLSGRALKHESSHFVDDADVALALHRGCPARFRVSGETRGREVPGRTYQPMTWSQ